MLESIAYICLLALAFAWVARCMGLPPLLGMLLAGVTLGPFGFNLLSDSLLDISSELRRIALVVILMRAGLALNIGELRRVGRSAILMCFVPACFEIAAITFFAPFLLGISWVEAAILGSVVAAVSPAVVVPAMLRMMEERRGTNKSIPQMIMAGAGVDDLFVIVLFSFFLALEVSGGGGGALSGEGIASLDSLQFDFAQLLLVPLSLALGLLFGWLLGLLAEAYFKSFHLRDTLKLIILLSVSFLLLAAEEYLPFSALLSVLACGATLLVRYEVLARRLSQKFSKLWVFAELMLFVLVGAAVDLNYAFKAGALALLILVIGLVFRALGVFVSLSRSALNWRERLFCVLAFLPKATVQAAIGSVPLSMGLGCGELVLSVAVIAILFTAPLGAIAIDWGAKKLLAAPSQQ